MSRSRLSEINPYKEDDILIYCSVGERSIQVAELLKEKGFKNVAN